MATVTERLDEVLEREAPVWDVRPTTDGVRRLSELDFGILWFDLAIGLLVIVAGGLLVPGLGLKQAILAIVIGSIAGSIPLALVGRAGAREGVPGMVLLRPVLGTRGSYLPSILNILQLVGWTGFELWAMALIAGRITGPIFGIDGFYVWLTVATLVCLLLSLGGPILVVRRWMGRFGVWVLVAAAGWITVRVLTTIDLGALWSSEGAGGFPSFAGGIDLVIALPVSWIPLVADYSRFARRGVSSGAGTMVGYTLGNAWFFALGALLVLGTGSVPTPLSIGEGIIALAGGTIVLVVLLVGETDEAFADIYSAGVSTQNLFPRLKLRPLVIAVSAVGVALAAYLFGLADEGVATYEFFLFFIGSIFVPLFGVFLADYYVVNRGRGYKGNALFDDRGSYRFTGGFSLAAMASWVLGFAVYHWVAPTPLAGWSAAVETFFADWLGLPFPLFDGAIPASVMAFAVAFIAMVVLRRRPVAPASR